MSIFDLLFLLLFLTSLIVLAWTAVTALRGRRPAAARRLRILGAGLAGYMLVVLLVGAVTPPRELPLGTPQCSDDWCITVVGADGNATGPTGRQVDVTFELASRARRVSQRERFVSVYLRDSSGHRYDPAPAGDQPPFDTLLAPYATIATHRSFRVPETADGLGVVVTREGDFAFPRCCIIGEGPLAKPAVTPLGR